MAKIIGGTAVTPMLVPDLKQTNPKRADYIKNKQVVASAIQGKASGEAIRLDDVSPFEHELSVKLSSDTVTDFSSVTVTKYGKNIFKPTRQTTTIRGITFDLLEDGTYHVYGTNDGTGSSFCDNYFVLPKGKYTGSGCPSGGGNGKYMLEFYAQTTLRGHPDYGSGVVFETDIEQRFTIHVLVYKGQTVDFIYKPMIEVGGNGDKVFEPYKEPTTYTPNADGTVKGIIGNGESITLMTDTEGVDIEAEYSVDTQKYIEKKFAELQALVLEV